jgi:hypothetical protein
LWAWADAADLPASGRALLLYEFEHELIMEEPRWHSREERQRLRYRSWSMLEVANYRRKRPQASPRLTGWIPTRTSLTITVTPYQMMVALDELSYRSNSSHSSDLGMAFHLVAAAIRADRPDAPDMLITLRDAFLFSNGGLREAPLEQLMKITMGSRKQVVLATEGYVVRPLGLQWGRGRPSKIIGRTSDTVRWNNRSS